MRNILLGFLLIAGYSSAQVSSSCDIPQALIDAYHKDIVQLATKRLVDIQSPDTVFVRVPQADYDSIAGGMAAILNATSIPESDSVFNLYCVHNHNGFPYDYAGFLVQVDTNYSWTDAWQSLNSLTGDAYIDTIMTRYSLDVVNFYNWSFGNYAELATDSAWNILAMVDTFELSPGVIIAEPNYFIGMAGTIEYNVVGTDRFYDFYFEFNDCFDGCDNYRKWMFKVDSACAVTYLGFTDWGAFGPQPLPPPLNCNIFTSVPRNISTDFSLYPNPVADKFTVVLPSHTSSEIKIYDAMGRVVLSQKVNTEKTSIDFSSYTSGIYLVEMNDGRSSITKKIIKTER
jgi:hypothetical protein